MVPAVPCSNLPPGMKLFIFFEWKKRGEFDLDFLHHHREFCVCILLKWRPYIQCQTICETFFKKERKKIKKIGMMHQRFCFYYYLILPSDWFVGQVWGGKLHDWGQPAYFLIYRKNKYENDFKKKKKQKKREKEKKRKSKVFIPENPFPKVLLVSKVLLFCFDFWMIFWKVSRICWFEKGWLINKWGILYYFVWITLEVPNEDFRLVLVHTEFQENPFFF